VGGSRPVRAALLPLTGPDAGTDAGPG
jgi:hypothetical protein